MIKQLLGVVLCGGQSTRMGRDKGLIPFGNTHWAKHVADKLQRLNLPVVASVNPTQLENYAQLFSPEKLIVDTISVEGPLKGLLSVHQQYPNQDLLLIACDMIDMEQATLANLIEQYQAEPTFEFYVYQNGEFSEPFGGIYTSAGLSKLMEKVKLNLLSRYSLKSVLDAGYTKRIPLHDVSSFKNYNSLS